MRQEGSKQTAGWSERRYLTETKPGIFGHKPGIFGTFPSKIIRPYIYKPDKRLSFLPETILTLLESCCRAVKKLSSLLGFRQIPQIPAMTAQHNG